MDTETKYAITATEKSAQYDANAKRLLGQKIILAHILTNVVDEFKGMNPKDAVSYIEGEPYINITPIEPGLTNFPTTKNGKKIVGLNTENSEANEGLIYFDIIFYVRMPDGLSQIIINVEPQKDEPSAYGILNRGIFYESRLISSQKERDFTNSNFNDIKRVYSIWVCMNMKENTLCHIQLMQKDIIGQQQWKGNLDIFNLIMIGLSKEIPPQDEKYELHRLLASLLSNQLTADEKCIILENEYNIPLKETENGGMFTMCNLGLGILEEGYAKGITDGIDQSQEKIVKNALQKGYGPNDIAEITGIDMEFIETVKKNFQN